MKVADNMTYLSDTVTALMKQWPDNRTVNIVCHGHSVPAGYFATPFVDTFNAYPHLFHRLLKERYPYAVVNVIVSAIGGETALAGAGRFAADVLAHRPDVVTIDYGLNDRSIGLEVAEHSWRAMIEASLQRGVKVLLFSPTWDIGAAFDPPPEEWNALERHAGLIRSLAAEYGVGLVDSFQVFRDYRDRTGDYTDLLAWVNHPNRTGHALIAAEMMRWFIVH